MQTSSSAATPAVTASTVNAKNNVRCLNKAFVGIALVLTCLVASPFLLGSIFVWVGITLAHFKNALSVQPLLAWGGAAVSALLFIYSMLRTALQWPEEPPTQKIEDLNTLTALGFYGKLRATRTNLGVLSSCAISWVAMFWAAPAVETVAPALTELGGTPAWLVAVAMAGLVGAAYAPIAIATFLAIGVSLTNSLDET